MAFPRTPEAVMAFARTINIMDSLSAQSRQMLRPLNVIAGMPLADGSALVAVRCTAVAGQLCNLIVDDIVYVVATLHVGERRARAAGCVVEDHTLLADRSGNVQALATGIVMLRTLYDARSLIAQTLAWNWDQSACERWRRAIESVDPAANATVAAA